MGDLKCNMGHYRPLNFTIISTKAHDGVLTEKYPNFRGPIRVAHWDFTTISDLGRLPSTLCYNGFAVMRSNFPNFNLKILFRYYLSTIKHHKT